MAHSHHCKICGIEVARCSDDSCLAEDHANNGEHYCSIHHPDPEHHVAPTPPLKR